MAEYLENKELVTYTFGFSTSNELIKVTQQQLDSIPYLSSMISHKDDFLSFQNENNEYILNPPIYHQWLLPILHAITLNKPYLLFSQLSKDENIFHILQLYDYLNMNSFPLPILKYDYLSLTNPTEDTNNKLSMKYSRGNCSEARNTAALFLLALANKKYNLNESETKKSILNLTLNILEYTNIYSVQFRHHTFKIFKKICWSFFTQNQLCQILDILRINRNCLENLNNFVLDDNQSLPSMFTNSFAWTAIISEDRVLPEVSMNSNILTRWHDWREFVGVSELGTNCPMDCYPSVWIKPFVIDSSQDNHDKKLCITDAQSARSGRFNTLPKRPKVDKFKHYYSSKVRKYHYRK